MTKDLFSLLKKRFDQNSMAQAYLLKTADSSQEENFERDFSLFCRDFFQIKGPSANHPDLLFMGQNSKGEKTTLSVSDLSSFFVFENSTPLRSHLRLVLWRAEALNEAISNKLLKHFEDPPSYIVHMILNPSRKKILSTLSGRCIELTYHSLKKEKITPDLTTQEQSSWDELFDMPRHEAWDHLKKSKERSPFFLKDLLNKSSQKDLSAKQITNLLKAIQDFDQSALYFHSPLERCVNIMETCRPILHHKS